MLRNTFKNIKSGMSLIELLIVITVIGILMAILVPQIGGTQEKTRDITRQTQVQELAAALMSYKQDYGEFPVILGAFQSGGTTTETPYRGNIYLLEPTLKAGGYITKIPKDPSGLSFSYSENYNDKSYDSVGYYLYLSDGKSFAIITLVEDEKNGNAGTVGENGGDLIFKLINDPYNDVFNGTINPTGNGGSMYVYRYKDEVL